MASQAKRKRSTCLRTLFALVLLTGASLPSAAEILYSVTDLGTLGGLYTQGLSINNAGQITGQSYTANGARHAFLYSSGQMQDLESGTPGYVYSIGYGISNAAKASTMRGRLSAMQEITMPSCTVAVSSMISTN